jgi:hypothetical protein
MIDGTGMCGGCRVMIGDIMTGSATGSSRWARDAAPPNPSMNI